MAVLDALVPKRAKPPSAPKEVLERIERGREAMRKDHWKRRLMVKFWQGEPYWYIGPKGTLQVLDTTLIGGTKQEHRVRNTYNFIHSVVEGKVSAASQRVPGYEVNPASTDREDYEGASIATQVAFYGYDKWRLRRHTTKAITNAFVQREGFVMPYFDANVGPFIQTDEGRNVGLGEIRFLNLTRSEVGWEPGCDFDDSPWHMIERAELVQDVKRMPGFVGGDVGGDAQAHDLPTQTTRNRALVTTFLERPCPEYPEGRRIVMQGGRVVVDARLIDPLAEDWWEPYPSFDADGKVTDELPIHRISYTVDPMGDDRGLVEHIIDLQRTINDVWNKLVEWKNRCLMPQRMAPRGSNVTRGNDVPGATNYYNVVGGQKPEWERPPQVPHELFQMLEQAKADLRALSADVDAVPEPDLAAKTLNAAIEQARLEMAELPRRPRGVPLPPDAPLSDSRGPPLCGAADHRDPRPVRLRVSEELHRPRPTLSGQRPRPARIVGGEEPAGGDERGPVHPVQLARSDPPEAALAVLHGSPAEGLMKSYENHTARAWRVCLKLAEGPQAMTAFPDRFDPEMAIMVPWWMPRKVDNIAIWKQVVADFMCTEQFDRMPPETQQVYELVFNGLEMQEANRAMVIAQQQMDQASQLGAANAARPQGETPMPSPKGLSPEQSKPDAVTPQQ